MLNAMIEYYTPLITSLKTMVGYKSGTLFGVSIASAITIEAIISILKLNFLGVSVGVIVMLAIFIVIDWFTGTAATRKRADTAMKNKDDKEFQKNKIKSGKVTFTIFKFMSLYLWLILTHTFMQSAINQGFIDPGAEKHASFGVASILRIITIIPIALFLFREFVSIGENIESLYGKKPYLFELGEKIFDILQFNFLARIKKATAPKSDDDYGNHDMDGRTDTNNQGNDNIIDEK